MRTKAPAGSDDRRRAARLLRLTPMAGSTPAKSPGAPYHVLFLCTGNSARSILAESILRDKAGGRFVAHSAGSHPAGRVHPRVLSWLRERGFRSRACAARTGTSSRGRSAPRSIS
jgi:hypothetical protein